MGEIKVKSIGVERKGLVARFNPWIGVSVLVLSILLFGCKANNSTAAKEKPAKIEKIEGSELSKIVLTEKAVQRIGLQTAAVQVEKVMRTRKVGGEVLASPVKASSASLKTPAQASGVVVQVALSKGELSEVNRTQAARVLALDDEENDKDSETADLAEVSDTDDTDDETVALQYVLKGGKKSLVAGQRVFVQLPLNAASQRSVVPYSSVIYDLAGDTWVYTNPQPLTFIRHKVNVDYIEGDLAVLSEGPPEGTPVVTAGVAQLFGVEFGVGK